METFCQMCLKYKNEMRNMLIFQLRHIISLFSMYKEETELTYKVCNAYKNNISLPQIIVSYSKIREGVSGASENYCEITGISYS